MGFGKNFEKRLKFIWKLTGLVGQLWLPESALSLFVISVLQLLFSSCAWIRPLACPFGVKRRWFKERVLMMKAEAKKSLLCGEPWMVFHQAANAIMWIYLTQEASSLKPRVSRWLNTSLMYIIFMVCVSSATLVGHWSACSMACIVDSLTNVCHYSVCYCRFCCF